jgi:hypothetical protein
MRTAREKPMMGSKGEVPGIFVRLVMRVRFLINGVRIKRFFIRTCTEERVIAGG